MAGNFKILSLLLFVASELHLNSGENILPINAAGTNDQPLELNCTILNDAGELRLVQWDFYRIGSDSSVAIYQNGEVVETLRDTYDVGSQRDNVIIRSMSYSTAGKYSCSTFGGTPVKRETQVAASSALECSTRDGQLTLEEGDTPELHCSSSVSTNSQLKPHFQWFRDGEPVEGYMKQPDSTPPPESAESFTFAYNMTITNKDDKLPYTCQMTYTYEGQPDENDDQSDPTFVDSCTIELDVLFAPTDVTIYPSPPDGQDWVYANVGDQFNCTARGTAPLEYEWFRFDDDGYQEGQYLEVVDSMVGPSMLVYNCTVKNVINGRTGEGTKSITFFAQGDSNFISPSAATLWIAIASSILAKYW